MSPRRVLKRPVQRGSHATLHHSDQVVRRRANPARIIFEHPPRHLLALAALVIATACGQVEDSPTTPPPVPVETAAETTTTRAGAPSTEATTTTAPATTVAETTTTAAASTTVAPTVPADEGSGFPVTVAGTLISEKPSAIVSMSATATETLFAIGAGDQVVAVDSTSNHPPEAPTTDLSAFQPNVEAIAAYEPDLVVISWDPGELASGLRAVNIPVLVLGAATGIEEAYEQMRRLGAATGNVEQAEDLVTSIQTEIGRLVERSYRTGEGLTYYHEVDDALYSATSATFIGGVYALFGLVNIADAAAEGVTYPQLSEEYILEADPDIIFFGCAVWCGTSPRSIAERPGWDGLRAVHSSALVEVDDDLSSRWGPRLADFARLIGGALESLAGGE